MTDKPKRGNVVVYGADIARPPLLDSDLPHMILIKDGYGEPMALLVRVLTDDMWGMCTRGDADWQAMLVRYGFAEMPTEVVAELIGDLQVKGTDNE